MSYYKNNFREEEKANEKLLLSRMMAQSKAQAEEQDADPESRLFRASEVPKHVYEPVFQNMMDQFPNRWRLAFEGLFQLLTKRLTAILFSLI